MPTEETTMELLEQREREAYKELGQMSFDDPNRGKVVSEAKTLAELRAKFEESENTRLNNNARNDIDEQRIRLDEEKLKNEKARTRFDVWKVLIYVAAGFGMNVSSYMFDEWFQDYKPLGRFKDRVHDLIIKK